MAENHNLGAMQKPDTYFLRSVIAAIETKTLGFSTDLKI